jgi:hypothetical protein
VARESSSALLPSSSDDGYYCAVLLERARANFFQTIAVVEHTAERAVCVCGCCERARTAYSCAQSERSQAHTTHCAHCCVYTFGSLILSFIKGCVFIIEIHCFVLLLKLCLCVIGHAMSARCCVLEM